MSQYEIILAKFIKYVEDNVDHPKVKSHIGTWKGRKASEVALLIHKYLGEWNPENIHLWWVMACQHFRYEPPEEVSLQVIKYLQYLVAESNRLVTGDTHMKVAEQQARASAQAASD